MLVFNFHHVEPETRLKSREHITITPEGLKGFIRFVRTLGIRTVSLKEVLEKGVDAMDRRDAVITFDDGFENLSHYAVPVLKEENCPATFFILAGKLGGTNDWDQDGLPEQERDRLMTLEQLKNITQSPLITIGSHGMTHQNLELLSEEEVLKETLGSHEFLSNNLPDAYLPIFAYPFGSYTQEIIETLMPKTPYKLAMYTRKGYWTPKDGPYEAPRFSIYYRDRLWPILMAKFIRNGILF